MRTGSLSPLLMNNRRSASYSSLERSTPSGLSQGHKASEFNGPGEKGIDNDVQRRNSVESGDYGSEGEWEFVDEHPKPEELSSNQWLRREIARILDLRIVHSTILFLLVIMGISMGIQAEYSPTGIWVELLHLLDNTLVLIFFVEVSLRLYALGFSFFQDGWNWFDLFVVVLSILPTLLLFFDSLDEAYNMTFFRVLRVFRLLRVLRSSKHLRLIVESLGKSLPNIGWILFFLFVVFYVFGLIATHAFGSAFSEWFGTLGKSMYTLFQVMTLESWSMGISRPVMAVYPYAWTFFIPFILIATYTTMNIFIAIIVTTMQTAHDEMIREEIDHRLGERTLAAEVKDARMFEEIGSLKTELVSMQKRFDRRSKKLLRKIPQQQQKRDKKGASPKEPRSPLLGSSLGGGGHVPANSQEAMGGMFDGNSAALPVPIAPRERKAVHPTVSTSSLLMGGTSTHNSPSPHNHDN